MRGLLACIPWSEFYFLDGIATIFLSVPLHILATVASLGERSGLYAFWVAVQAMVAILSVLLNFRRLMPSMWWASSGAVSKAGATSATKPTARMRATITTTTSGGRRYKTSWSSFWKFTGAGSLTLGVFSFLAFLDKLQHGRLRGIAVLFGVVRSLVMFVLSIFLPVRHLLEQQETSFCECLDVRSNASNLVTWIGITVVVIVFVGRTPIFSNAVSTLLFVLSQALAVPLDIYVAISKRKDVPLYIWALVVVANTPIVVYALMFTFAFLHLTRGYNAVLGILYLYAVTNIFLMVLVELVDRLPVFSNKDTLYLPLYLLQFFGEFTVALVFFDADISKVTFWVLIVIVGSLDVIVESGVMHERFHIYFKSDESKTGRATYLARKAQLIHQKELAETLAILVICAMVMVELVAGESLGRTLLSDFAGVKSDTQRGRLLLGYGVMFVVNLLTVQLSHRLLKARMIRLREDAKAEVARTWRSENAYNIAQEARNTKNGYENQAYTDLKKSPYNIALASHGGSHVVSHGSEVLDPLTNGNRSGKRTKQSPTPSIGLQRNALQVTLNLENPNPETPDLEVDKDPSLSPYPASTCIASRKEEEFHRGATMVYPCSASCTSPGDPTSRLGAHDPTYTDGKRTPQIFSMYPTLQAGQGKLFDFTTVSSIRQHRLIFTLGSLVGVCACLYAIVELRSSGRTR